MSALNDSNTGGIPNTEPRGAAESNPQQIHQEGIQQVQEATQASQANQSGVNSGTAADEGTGTKTTPRSAPEPVREQPPASNPGSDDPTGGIAKHAGGVSGAAYIGSPVQDEEQGIVNSVKSFLGLSVREEKRAEDTLPAVNAGSAMPAIAAPAAASSGVGKAAGREQSAGRSFTAEIPDRTKPSAAANTIPIGAAGSYAISTGPESVDDRTQNPDTSTSSRDPPSTTTPDNNITKPGPDFSANERTSTVPSALGSTTTSTSHHDTDSSATADPVIHKSQPADAHEKDAHKPPKPADGGKHGGKQENPSAIPSAGGERLGEKHWGESEIVPDLPKKRASDAGQAAGVSSTDGQPTSEVADNTAANTGGATSGPHGHDGASSSEKHGPMDKIKEKLHIGQK